MMCSKMLLSCGKPTAKGKPEAGKFERIGGHDVLHHSGQGHAPSGPGGEMLGAEMPAASLRA